MNLHLKSHDPAASRTLLGCQSRLRMVERIGFLMCLHTHLRVTTDSGNGIYTSRLFVAKQEVIR